MRRFRNLLEFPYLCLFFVGVAGVVAHTFVWMQPVKAPTVAFVDDPNMPLETKARAALGMYCGSCHQSGRSGMDLDENALDLDTMRRHRSEWLEVVDRIRNHKMPPRRFPQPTAIEREHIIAWIEQEVLQKKPATGPMLARRLQRIEYANVIRDLLGVKARFKAEFPEDEARWSPCETVPELPASLAAAYRGTAEQAIDDAIAAELEGETQDAVNDEEGDGREAISSERVSLFSRDCSRGSSEQARLVLTNFVRRAYRKIADVEEVDRLTGVFEQAESGGASYHDGLKAAMTEVLTSPSFLFRVESKAPKTSNPFELAARLSFFLWRTGPDDEFMTLAATGDLMENLEEQTLRLLRDPRSRAFAVGFAEHWLSLSKLEEVAAEMNAQLKRAMRRETEEFFAAMVREDRSVLEFIDGDFTYVDEVLAGHYGIAGVKGNKMQRISVDRETRGGLLGQASVLTIVSANLDDSVVRRGKWIAESLLGEAPIRPPAGLLEAFDQLSGSGGMLDRRRRIAAHRTNPACAECHRKLDGMGIAMDHLDRHGAWRDSIGYEKAVPLGDIADGVVLNGLGDLKAYLLKNHSSKFARALAERIQRFALGRLLDDRARAELKDVPENAAKHQFRLSRMIVDVVQTPTFRERFGAWE